MTDLLSTLAVASSRTRILFLLSRARARHTSCFCPTLKFAPPSVTTPSRPPSSSSTADFSCTCVAGETGEECVRWVRECNWECGQAKSTWHLPWPNVCVPSQRVSCHRDSCTRFPAPSLSPSHSLSHLLQGTPQLLVVKVIERV